MITKLKKAGIQSVFDLAISISHQLVDIGGGMLTGTDEHAALELVTKAKKALVDSGILNKDFSTAQDILDMFQPSWLPPLRVPLPRFDVCVFLRTDS